MRNDEHGVHESELSRREVLQRGGLVAAAAGTTLLIPGTSGADSEQDAGRRARVTLTEGTNVAASLSPDGRRIAFDLVTGIWVLPIEGGSAVRLTDDLQDATQPRWSADSRKLVFQSYRDGNFHLWLVDPDGGAARQLTSGPFDHREPSFSPDGKLLAFTSDRGGTGSYGVFTYNLASGAIRAVTDTLAEEAMPVWFPDGRRIAYTVDESAIDAVDVGTGEVSRLVAAPPGTRLFGPSVAPDGQTLSHVRLTGAVTELVVGSRAVTSGEDVFAFAASWLSANEVLYTADGRVWRRRLDGARVAVPFQAEVTVRRRRRPAESDVDSESRRVKGIASPVCAPDGRTIAFRALNALWLMDIGSRPRRIVADGYFASDPDFSPDGRSLVYCSDRAGDADLWLRDLATGTERRLTALPGAQLTPRWSPDGGTRTTTARPGSLTWQRARSGRSRRPCSCRAGRPGRRMATWWRSPR